MAAVDEASPEIMREAYLQAQPPRNSGKLVSDESIGRLRTVVNAALEICITQTEHGAPMPFSLR